MVEDDAELLNVDLNLDTQKYKYLTIRVIKNDCDRTRVRDRASVKSFREYLEYLLTYYCLKYKIRYKQGMNEVLGPLILLKSKISITLSRIFNLYSCFMEKYLSNYYHEDEFYSLQSSLALLKILLKYHQPELYNIFENGLITPEMYATSWILTIFAKYLFIYSCKTKFELILALWDLIIIENDEIFIHFIIIAYLIKNRDVNFFIKLAHYYL